MGLTGPHFLPGVFCVSTLHASMLALPQAAAQHVQPSILLQSPFQNRETQRGFPPFTVMKDEHFHCTSSPLPRGHRMAGRSQVVANELWLWLQLQCLFIASQFIAVIVALPIALLLTFEWLTKRDFWQAQYFP